MKRYRLSGYSYNGKLKRMEMLEHGRGEWVRHKDIEPYIRVVNTLSEVEIGSGDCPMWLNQLVLNARKLTAAEVQGE